MKKINNLSLTTQRYLSFPIKFCSEKTVNKLFNKGNVQSFISFDTNMSLRTVSIQKN